MQAKPLEQEARRVDWKDLMLNRMGALLGLIIIMIGLSLATPRFFTVGNLMNVAQQSAINALVASGMLLAISRPELTFRRFHPGPVHLCLGILIVKWG